MCVKDSTGKLQMGHYKCPDTTLFSEFYRRCIESSISGCEPETSTTTTTTTTQSSSTCKIAGSFVNTNVPKCMAYYNCIRVLDKLVRIDHACPVGTVYHLTKKRCVPDTEYTCPL